MVLIYFLISLVVQASPQYVFYGDMVVEKPNRAASLLDVQLWEDGVLPLEFSDSITEDQRKEFFSACNDWGRFANIKCQVGEYKGRVVQVTTDLGGCWAFWGMGIHFGVLSRRINLAKGCWHRRTLLHEIGHAFGLIHEHQRPDRDVYIEIVEDNIDSGFLGLQTKVNFDKQDALLKIPYDFLSIMHYSRTAFSKNGKDTVRPREQYTKFLDIMGNVNELSDGDKQTMQSLYP